MRESFDRLRHWIANRMGTSIKADTDAAEYRILFVCMGNICRSPTAEGMIAKALREALPDVVIETDSAGTHAYHVGEPPDPRARRAALRRGVDLGEIRARPVTAEDFERFDLIVAMDRLNRVVLEEIAPPERHKRIRLLLDFAPDPGREDVPDPYYGGGNGFEIVLDLIESAADGLIEHVRGAVRR